jgi:hypothetical protein
MADLSAKKTAYAQEVAAYAARLLDVVNDGVELEAFWFANTFGAGGANEIVAGDLIHSSIAHLAPSNLADVVNAIGTLKTAMTSGIRDNLRKASAKVIA